MVQTASPVESGKPHLRIELIDLARGIALLAMASYHFTFDLALFGIIDRKTPETGGWKLYALSIASSFLILVGMGLVLANGNRRLSQINWKAWGKRFFMICGCALLITIVTWFQNPGYYVFFGILHEIAFASLAGLLFLRRSAWFCALSAIVVFVIANQVESPLLDAPIFWWTGLQAIVPPSVDYVPVFPWFGMVLSGMALIKAIRDTRFWNRLKTMTFEGPMGRFLQLLGRHSLLFYMLHQPILFGSVYLFCLLSGRI